MINDRAREFREFCTAMLGTTETNPLMVGETPVNGATIGALLEAFRNCYPQEKPAATPAPKQGTNDPLGLLSGAAKTSTGSCVIHSYGLDGAPCIACGASQPIQ